MKHFCVAINIEYKILLLLDNTPSHPSTETLTSADRKVTTCFLPPNSTSVQPMDQGILEAFNGAIRSSYLDMLSLKMRALC